MFTAAVGGPASSGMPSNRAEEGHRAAFPPARLKTAPSHRRSQTDPQALHQPVLNYLVAGRSGGGQNAGRFPHHAAGARARLLPERCCLMTRAVSWSLTRPAALASPSAASTLVTPVTMFPGPSAWLGHHTASPALTISRVSCLTPA